MIVIHMGWAVSEALHNTYVICVYNAFGHSSWQILDLPNVRILYRVFLFEMQSPQMQSPGAILNIYNFSQCKTFELNYAALE